MPNKAWQPYAVVESFTSSQARDTPRMKNCMAVVRLWSEFMIYDGY